MGALTAAQRASARFFKSEARGSVLLLLSTVTALVWANSPWSGSYFHLLETKIGVTWNDWKFALSWSHWLNDGLMALFFLVVGLEIKREFLSGELRDRRAAALPVIAAVGGMVFPALIYLAINAGGDGAHGWGIAMPTDIAFTLGILALASRNAPPGLRSFVLTLAIVDDILTFVVIAIFYPSELDLVPILVAAALVTAMIVLPRLGIRAPLLYVGLGVGVWLAMNASGVPAALAGVVVGLLTPAAPIPRRRGSVPENAVAPLARVEHLLLPWTSFVILPLFALANAGVRVSSSALTDALHSPVSVGIVVGRILGKIAGIALAAWVATRLGARLPAGTRFAHVVGVAAAAAIAFTVSLFVADLAFVDRPGLISEAKIGILTCAPIAGALGYLLLRAAGRRYSETD